jgi:hypothetical protein
MNLNPKASKPVLVCAFGVLAAFFMPWVQLFGVGMSGYNLGQLGSYGNYAWIILLLAAGTILLSFCGMNNRPLGAITGIVPLGAVLYGLLRLSSEGGAHATQGVLDIAQHLFSIGAYLTIIFSIALIIAAFAQPGATRAPAESPDAFPGIVPPADIPEGYKLSVEQAAQALSVTRGTLQSYIRSGRINVNPDHTIDAAALLRAGFIIRYLPSRSA